MKLYVVRHAESEASAAGVFQNNDSNLSKVGVVQAEAIAKRLSKLEVGSIMSSPIQRTRQTAEIIAGRLGRTVEYSDLFVERRDPSEIEGKPLIDPHCLEVKKLMRDNISNPEWRHSDEETFLELKARALDGLGLLQNLQAENVILVSHGEFIAMLLNLMIFGSELDPSIYLKLRNSMWDHNVGLSVCSLRGENWKLLTWNDYSHLEI